MYKTQKGESESRINFYSEKITTVFPRIRGGFVWSCAGGACEPKIIAEIYLGVH